MTVACHRRAPKHLVTNRAPPGKPGGVFAVGCARRTPSVPLVIISGETNPSIQANLLALGANEFLVKSKTSGSSLIERARYWVEVRQSVNDCTPGSTRPRLLVVDDDPMMSMIVGGYLYQEGIAVEAATTARGCLEALDAPFGNPPLAILLDILLADDDAFGLIR